MGALTALQLIFNFLVQLLILRIVGIGHLTDAFIAAQAVPLVLFSIISVSLSSVWQPRLSLLNNNRVRWKDGQGVALGQAVI